MAPRARLSARAERYCLMEVGHAAQNVLLQAEVLGLAAVPIGAFDARGVAGALKLPRGERAAYLVSVGCRR